jgi:hypothetical protein
MRDASPGDRLIALFLLGVLAFSPPLLAIFNTDSLVLGVPLLFLYLFGAWIAVIALVATVLRPRGEPRADDGPER